MNPHTLIRRTACAMLLTLLAVAGHAQNGHWEDDCACYRDMRWGSARWIEPATGQQLTQSLDFFPLSMTASKQPLVIYAHPNLATKTIQTTDPRWSRLIAPARAAGFAVASIEFRHPVENDDIVPTPHNDLAQAIRWITDHADTLGIDTRNVFYLGHSRGSLLLWTALAYSGVLPDSVNAVYCYNGQVSYRGKELAERFVFAPDRAQILNEWLQEHPQDPLFGSALYSVDAADPPLLLKYELAFFNRLVSAAEINEHHPDFGLAMCAAYAEAGIGSRCQAIDQVPSEQGYDGFVPFFQKYLR
jgi:hypothetical protein